MEEIALPRPCLDLAVSPDLMIKEDWAWSGRLPRDQHQLRELQTFLPATGHCVHVWPVSTQTRPVQESGKKKDNPKKDHMKSSYFAKMLLTDCEVRLKNLLWSDEVKNQPVCRQWEIPDESQRRACLQWSIMGVFLFSRDRGVRNGAQHWQIPTPDCSYLILFSVKHSEWPMCLKMGYINKLTLP